MGPETKKDKSKSLTPKKNSFGSRPLLHNSHSHTRTDTHTPVFIEKSCKMTEMMATEIHNLSHFSNHA